jgi:uncharacterized protein (DUF433 family)
MKPAPQGLNPTDSHSTAFVWILAGFITSLLVANIKMPSSTWEKHRGDPIMPSLDRITFDPTIMGGRACIRGMRATVALVLNLVANGMSTAEILDAYPYLEEEAIRQALRYAAWLAEESVHPAELLPAA